MTVKHDAPWRRRGDRVGDGGKQDPESCLLHVVPGPSALACTTTIAVFSPFASLLSHCQPATSLSPFPSPTFSLAHAAFVERKHTHTHAQGMRQSRKVSWFYTRIGASGGNGGHSQRTLLVFFGKGVEGKRGFGPCSGANNKRGFVSHQDDERLLSSVSREIRPIVLGCRLSSPRAPSTRRHPWSGLPTHL